ncbi:sensor histidine kinase [Microlunatus ginsengisoli]|uniref:histidine kinase n=1 Tax=Microlunatus ginsengisoli TaxID=363863 RepID=A0ABP6ZV90_9ACTN
MSLPGTEAEPAELAEPWPRDDRSRVIIRRAALLVWAGLSVACLLIGSTSPAGVTPLLVALLAAATALWCGALFLSESRRALRTTALIMFGVLGAVLDLLQPRGPGFVAGFMAVAGLSLLLPIRSAALAAVAVFLALAYAEARASETPWTAVLNIGLGLAFMAAAAAFASANRGARERAQLLLEQQRSIAAALEREAVLTERTRLARELHDVLAHTLSGLSLHLEAARLLAERTDTDTRVREQIDVASRYARNGVAEGKRAIAALRGEPTAGIDDVPGLVAQFRQDAGIPAALEQVGPAGTLDVHASLAVYRIVQESLSNVRKHAPRSSSVQVTLSWDADGIRVEVVNHDPSGASEARRGSGAGSYGLTGLGERVTALGGTFEAGPVADGFSVSARMASRSDPVHDDDH